uniref:ABC transporter permease n=1 Tax=Solibacter usitatus (strain Ellin6076) TaxID=234267 RepID=Q01SG7_SOLUE
MHPFSGDLRHGARLLGKAPEFTAAALLALALGMGATTAIFSVVDTVLLKPLPFRDPGRLLVVWEKNPSQNRFKLFVAPANFLAWRKESRSVDQMAAIQENVRINLTAGPNGYIDPEELKAERVSGNLFETLGVRALLGRTFLNEEDQPGRANFVLLSQSLWQRRFGGDPAIAGKSIRLRDQPYTVVGVLPAGFAVLEPGVDVFVPLALNPNDPRSANARFVTVIARGKAGIDQVRAELEGVGARMELALPALNKGWRPSVFVLEDELVGGVRHSLWVMMGAVGFLLLMACVNVANLLLARGASRRREFALRAALGAGRGRIVSQLLSESLLLSLAGGLLGLLLALGAVSVLAHTTASGVPRLAEAHLDFRLFAFALAVSILTGVLFGIVPALRDSGANIKSVLSEGGRGGTAGRSGRVIRNTLVAAEIALAVVVLIGAGLLVRSFVQLRSVNPGFQPAGILTARVPLSGGRNSALERRISFFQQLTARLAAVPGVRSVGAVNGVPLSGLGAGSPFAVEGRPAPSAEHRPTAIWRSVTPAYFQTMAIPLIAGRTFTGADNQQATPVILVNQTLARRFWPGTSALGGRIAIDQNGGRVAEIVGVVGDVKPVRIDDEEWPTIYSPYAQAPVAAMTLTVRTTGAPMTLASAVLREIHQLDPDQPVAEVRPMEEVVDHAVAGARFNTLVLGIFACVAFLLAAVGIYGVISYDVTERTNEIGIRMALGAQPGDVLKLVMGQGARLAVYGIAAGLLGAAALTRLMGAMLFGVTPTDARTFALISILLAIVALGASYLPSRRAMALDPVTALRHE